jgi:hypothetical protein
MSDESRIAYWVETVEEALAAVGLEATPDQLNQIANDVQIAHECYGMAFGHDSIPNPLAAEIKELKTKLDVERRKAVCPRCLGSGEEISIGPYHTGISQCLECRGEGSAEIARNAEGGKTSLL